MLLLARRYRCFNPQCSFVREAVKKKMKTHGAADIYTVDHNGKRLITGQERGCMRDGRLEGIPPGAGTIKTFLNGGWSFSIDDER